MNVVKNKVPQNENHHHDPLKQRAALLVDKSTSHGEGSDISMLILIIQTNDVSSSHRIKSQL